MVSKFKGLGSGKKPEWDKSAEVKSGLLEFLPDGYDVKVEQNDEILPEDSDTYDPNSEGYFVVEDPLGQRVGRISFATPPATNKIFAYDANTVGSSTASHDLFAEFIEDEIDEILEVDHPEIDSMDIDRSVDVELQNKDEYSMSDYEMFTENIRDIEESNLAKIDTRYHDNDIFYASNGQSSMGTVRLATEDYDQFETYVESSNLEIVEVH